MSRKAKRTNENWRMEIAGKYAAFNLIIEQLISALDKLTAKEAS